MIIIDLLKFLLFIILYPFLLINEWVKEEKKFRDTERLWQAESFEFDNGRYRNDTFELVDGKIAFRKGI